MQAPACLLLTITAAINTVTVTATVTTSTFSVTKDAQLVSGTCHPVTSPKRLSRIQCGGLCGLTPGCLSFNLLCNTSSSAQCQCHVCFTADVTNNTLSTGSAYGVMIFKNGGQPVVPTTPGPTTTPATTEAQTTSVVTTQTTTQTTTPTTTTTTPTTTTTTPTTTTTTPTTTTTTTTTTTSSTSTTTTPTITTTPTTTTPTSTLGPVCPAPPLLGRTKVSRTFYGTYDIARYSCRIDSDRYILGTTDVTCTNGTWPQATILCAPTTCYYNHPVWKSVYAGTLNSTISGYDCDRWDLNSTSYFRYHLYIKDANYLVDGSRTPANTYCRTFHKYDNWATPWCYTGQMNVPYNVSHSENCTVPLCPVVAGVLLN